MSSRKRALALGLSLLGSAALAAPAYRPAGAIALGAPDRWDYVVSDADGRRVYVAHGDRLTVIDSTTRSIVGDVSPIPGGTHGVAISSATGQGFTDSGKDGKIVAFDLATLKITQTLPADVDADGMAFDRKTGHVFVIEGDPGAITVVDPARHAVVATIKAGEKMEYAVGDDAGSIYVAGEEKGDLLRVDAGTNAVAAHWPAPGCTSPHGLAIDKAGRRLFMGCANSAMIVMDADNGRVVATLPIGRGNDAVAYDPARRRVFSSNGVDGTITAYQQRSPDRYAALETIPTTVSGRTMTLDPSSGRLFVAAADVEPAKVAGERPRPRPGTLKLLMFDPVR